MFDDLRSRLRSIFHRRRIETELDDELLFHLDRQVEKYVGQGLAPVAATRRARLELGGLDQVKEECRDARGVRPLDDLAQDLRFGVRVLRKSPGFTLLAVLTLALGICATSTILSWIDATLLDP